MSILTETAPTPNEADASQASSVVRLWMPLLLLSVICLRIMFAAAGPIKDPDSWWHLRVGREFWSGNWTLRETGPLSSFATESWIPRDWIPQLVASKFEDWFGLPGVAWLYGAALLAFMIAAYLTCRREADPLPATMAVALCFLAASGSLSQRPQMVSFIFMFLLVGAWMATCRDLRPRWWLIPLMWVWAACHGMWYCGIAVGIAVMVGLVLDRRVAGRDAVKLASIPVLSVVAAALTPVGPGLLLTLFDTTGMWQFVTEWQPPSFRTLGPATALVMIFVVVVTWSRRTRATSWAHIGLLVVAVGWTLLAARTVVLGAIVLAPLVAATMHGWVRQGHRHRLGRPEMGFIAVLVGSSLLGLALAVPNTAAKAGGVPNSLNDELTALPQDSTILNEYSLGGWLHWRHPDLQTMVDGFTDGYTPDDVADYMAARDVADGWDRYVANSKAESALLEVNSPLATALEDRLGWERIGEDEGFVLLIDSGR